MIKSNNSLSVLAIDATSETLSISIELDGKKVFDLNKRKKHGASLAINYIKDALAELNIGVNAFDVFVVGAGPGSFTGLRISFSLIKAFGLSFNKPIISLGSFFSCAAQVINPEKEVAVISDARRNLIYGASFKLKGDKIIRKGKENLYKIDDFIKKNRDANFITYDECLIAEALKINKNLDFKKELVWPKASCLLKSAKMLYNNRKFTPLDRLEPIYVYPKDCQVRKIKK